MCEWRVPFLLIPSFLCRLRLLTHGLLSFLNQNGELDVVKGWDEDLSACLILSVSESLASYTLAESWLLALRLEERSVAIADSQTMNCNNLIHELSIGAVRCS